MNFINLKQLQNDVREWSAKLPDDIVAVAGVPRSGILPATLLALHRNIHLVTMADLVAGLRPWQFPLRRNVSGKFCGRVLVLDDTMNTGGSLSEARRVIPPSRDLVFGALYYRELIPEVADVAFREVSMPRCFEWNLFHCSAIRKAAVDLDGVICEDPSVQEEDEGHPQHPAWLNHLVNAKPRFIPGLRIKAVVTSRLERYRRDTENYLRQTGVRYGNLIMSNYGSAKERRAGKSHAKDKASYYKSRGDIELFVESDQNQARVIADVSGKPVVCTDTMQIF